MVEQHNRAALCHLLTVPLTSSVSSGLAISSEYRLQSYNVCLPGLAWFLLLGRRLIITLTVINLTNYTVTCRRVHTTEQFILTECNNQTSLPALYIKQYLYLESKKQEIKPLSTTSQYINHFEKFFHQHTQ